MAREVKLARLDEELANVEYPVERDEAVAAFEDVTLALADGTANLGRTIDRSDAERFESVDELRSEVLSQLPRRAVGEPYQSEGEG
ncbi:DUF5789 family protein [Halorientalis pallida]|uniref:DUF2795 domain-containing protein n=1 Tax=Halorientalis pallida TaxID=2479928 RepID=A0A498L6C7_9EURY|nr:hypothetical protein [Halorientalis pallida]RXK51842.1 hypothetical protein EAF64_04195 [Halorientalis pallida]